MSLLNGSAEYGGGAASATDMDLRIGLGGVRAADDTAVNALSKTEEVLPSSSGEAGSALGNPVLAPLVAYEDAVERRALDGRDGEGFGPVWLTCSSGPDDNQRRKVGLSSTNERDWTRLGPERGSTVGTGTGLATHLLAQEDGLDGTVAPSGSS